MAVRKSGYLPVTLAVALGRQQKPLHAEPDTVSFFLGTALLSGDPDNRWFDSHVAQAAAATDHAMEALPSRGDGDLSSAQVSAMVRAVTLPGSGLSASRLDTADGGSRGETLGEAGEDLLSLLMRALRFDCAALRRQVAELRGRRADMSPDTRCARVCQAAISCCEDILAWKRTVAEVQGALQAAGSSVWQVLEARNAIHELRLIKQTGSTMLRVKGKREAVERACELLRQLPREPAGPWKLREELCHRPCPVETADGGKPVQGPSLGGLLAIAAGDVGCLAAVELLASFGAASALSEPDAGNSGFTAALRAAKNGEVEFLRALHAHGAGESLSAPNHTGCTPARLACQEGHTSVLNTLVECGALASLSAVKTNGTAPAHVAAQQGHMQCIQTIVRHAGAQALAATNKRGLTLAHFAANMGRLGCLETIEQLGGAEASFGAKSHKKSTPLHLAAAKGHASCVRFLLCQRTAPCAKYPDGRYCGSLEALGPIVASRYPRDCLRQATALQMAAFMGHMDATMELVMAGADVDRLGPAPVLLPRSTRSEIQAGLVGLMQQAAAGANAGAGAGVGAVAGAQAAAGANGAAQAGAVGAAPGDVVGVAQQLAHGFAAALHAPNGALAGPQQIPGAPGVVFHQFAIPLGNNIVVGNAAGGGAAAAGAADVAVTGAGEASASNDSEGRVPGGAMEVLDIPPESEMAAYLRVLRGNAPLRAAELRLCWAMAMSASIDFVASVSGRPLLSDDLYVHVAEHLHSARVALMLHRRTRELITESRYS